MPAVRMSTRMHACMLEPGVVTKCGTQASIFESLGIRGSFGIDYLGKIRVAYAQDAEMLRTFYEWVRELTANLGPPECQCSAPAA